MLHTVCKRYTLTQEVLLMVLVLPQAEAVSYIHQGAACWVNRVAAVNPLIGTSEWLPYLIPTHILPGQLQ